MKEINFKTLMYMDKYVDANLLYTGIYWRTVPNLYPKDDTIETLIERGRAIKDMDGNSLITEEYIQNLKECQLVPIVIMEANSILPSIEDCIEKAKAMIKVFREVDPKLFPTMSIRAEALEDFVNEVMCKKAADHEN